MAMTNAEKQRSYRMRMKEQHDSTADEIVRLRKDVEQLRAAKHLNQSDRHVTEDADQIKDSFFSGIRQLLDGLHAEGKKTEATTSPKTVAYITAKLEEMLVGWDMATYGKPKRCCLCGDPIVHGARVVIPGSRAGFAHWKCQNKSDNPNDNPAEFEFRVQQECMKRLDEFSIPAYLQKIEKLSQMFRWPRNSVMTKSEYNTILMCLHPDRMNALTPDQMAEAFRIFTHYRHKLVLDDDAIKATMSTLPRTKEEMLSRKATKRGAAVGSL